jgi:Peptidase family M1 domain/Secretion system C-terminal sorting domain/Peptidase M1 N-terminal domain
MITKLGFMKRVLPIFLLIVSLPSLSLAGLPFFIDDQSNGNIHHVSEEFCQDYLNQTLTLDTTVYHPYLPTSYEFDLDFDFTNSTFVGSSRITIEFIESVSEFTLDFSNSLNTVTTVHSNMTGPIPYLHANDIITIIDTFEEGSTLDLLIEYNGEAGTINGPFGAMGLWMTGNRAWTFAFPDGAHAFVPLIDNVDTKVPVYWSLTVPEPLTAVANGSLADEFTQDGRTTFTWYEPNPVCSSEMGFCIAEYEIITAQTEPFPIRYYVYPNAVDAATFDLERVPEAVQVFEEAFGYDYPFSELKICMCGVFNGNGGQEHQTMVSLGHNMITGSRTYESIIVHEVCHQWFADLISPSNWDHFWLNEGFATYSEAIWAEHHDGWVNGYLHEIDHFRNNYLNWENSGNNDALVNDNYFTTMNSPLPYDRGALALHQLRMRYGMDTFTTAVGQYQIHNAMGHVVSETLMDEFIEETVDNNLNDWFDEWVYQGEVPLIYWTRLPGDNSDKVYARQMFEGSNSPSHNNIYDSMELSFGYESETNRVSEQWPQDSPWMTLSGISNLTPVTGETPKLLSNYEFPARLIEKDDIVGPELEIELEFTDENVYSDHVLQADEYVTATLHITNRGLPMENVSWSVNVPDSSPLTITPNSGALDNLGYLYSILDVPELVLQNSNISPPQFLEVEFNFVSDEFDIIVPYRIPVGFSEILLLADGFWDLHESVGPALSEAEIVWGYTFEEIENIGAELYETSAILYEIDGFDYQDVFSDNASNIRDFINNGGNAIVCGTLVPMIEVYNDASPEWQNIFCGELHGTIETPAYTGVAGDPITDGRVLLTDNADGVTQCSPVDGSISIMHSATDPNASAGCRQEIGNQRKVGLGFRISELRNDDMAQMSRDEFVQRAALWILGRSTSIEETPATESSLPINFAIEAYPNPFNPTVNLNIQLPEASKVKASVYNLLGQKVADLINQEYQAGTISLIWNGSEEASGVYIVRVESQNATLTKRIVLMR